MVDMMVLSQDGDVGAKHVQWHKQGDNILLTPRSSLLDNSAAWVIGLEA